MPIEWFVIGGRSVHECSKCGGLTNNPAETCRSCANLDSSEPGLRKRQVEGKPTGKNAPGADQGDDGSFRFEGGAR